MLRPTLVVLLLASLSLPTWATDCPQFYAAGQPPIIAKPSLKPRTQELCFRAYSVMHSGLSRTPLWSAEHLVRADVEAAQALSRRDSFHAESRLPPSDRAELSDYARSGYDRGHMAPNGDMPDRLAQGESFSLANMVPQVHANNAGVWAGIEGAVRQLALDEGELYVVTGPAFIGANVQRIGNVLVPSHLWKAVYSPRQRRAGAYVVTNDATREYSTISIAQLETMTGIDALPGVSPKFREAGMNLPRPKSTRGGKKKGKEGGAEAEFTLRELSRSFIDAIERTLRK